MPLGVPKVPDLTGEEQSDKRDVEWKDLFSALYENRLIFLFHEIDSEVSTRIISALLTLAIYNKRGEGINLLINSVGGAVMDGLAIYDTMQLVGLEVTTVGMGMVASTASLLLAGGGLYKRMALTHTRIMLHQPSADIPDTRLGNVMAEIDEIHSVYETVARIYAERTGQSFSTIVEDMDRDTFFSVQEATDYGLIDGRAVPTTLREKKQKYYTSPWEKPRPYYTSPWEKPEDYQTDTSSSWT